VDPEATETHPRTDADMTRDALAVIEKAAGEWVPEKQIERTCRLHPAGVRSLLDPYVRNETIKRDMSNGQVQCVWRKASEIGNDNRR
jgi:hypothetical protein